MFGRLSVFRRHLNSQIPRIPVIPPYERSTKRAGSVTPELVEHLEKLSLVDFANAEGVKRLEEAIAFAEPLKEVDTTGVEPLYSVLEDQALRLRDDVVTEGNCREEILSNATKVDEDFFVAPPGNIPLKVDRDKYLEEKRAQ